jgi:hypothetical protein
MCCPGVQPWEPLGATRAWPACVDPCCLLIKGGGLAHATVGGGERQKMTLCPSIHACIWALKHIFEAPRLG